MQWICSFLMLIGRICLGMIFVWAAVDKVTNYDTNAHLIASKGITLIPLFLFGACFVELLGSFSLIFGYRVRFGALILMLYLVPATAIFHDFWMYVDGEERYLQTILFLKNLAIFGGLLYVLANGAGCCSCDRARQKRVED